MEEFFRGYKAAGVDITAGLCRRRIDEKSMWRATMTPGAIGGLGGLAACLSWT